MTDGKDDDTDGKDDERLLGRSTTAPWPLPATTRATTLPWLIRGLCRYILSNAKPENLNSKETRECCQWSGVKEGDCWHGF